MAIPKEIQFTGPASMIPDEEGRWPLSESSSVPGVYFFAVEVGDRYHVFYVGEAGNVFERMRGHLAAYLAGRYWVYDVSDLRLARLSKVWSPSEPEVTLSRIHEHRALLEPMLRLVKIFVAGLPPDCMAPDRRRIESAIVKAFRADLEAHSFLENARLSVDQRNGHEPVIVGCSKAVYGLPRELSV